MMTLEELKAENAQAQIEQPEEVTEAEQEQEQETETETEGEQPTEEVEDWLKADEPASQAVPLAKHIDLKHKLKARISEKDEENAQLKAKLAAYESGAVQLQQPQQQLKAPRLADFDYDEDAYANAVAEYQSALIDAKLNQRTSSQQQQQQFQQMQRKVDEHYERAAELVKSGAIDETKYQQADLRVRTELANLYNNPEQGDAVADSILARMGAGSEKVWAHLGVNPAALDGLKRRLSEDPTGIEAAIYLGELKTKFNSKPNKLSAAPKPDTPLNGDVATGSLSGSALRNAYEDASKKGDSQKAFDLKRQARASGVNTQNW